MTERRFRVALTAGFLARLNAIEEFLLDAEAGSAFDRLLDELRVEVVRNLARFPRIGRPYLDDPPRSAEALALLAALPAGTADALRTYAHGDYLLLYLVADRESTVHLLSIRHHRESTFESVRGLIGKGGDAPA